jgi:hypothetical protein
MKSFKEELAKVLAIKDEAACAKAFEKFCRVNADSLPLPGADPAFDKAMWAASEHTTLSAKDESILKKVTGRLLGEQVDVVASACLKLKDLIGATKETAIQTWQDMLAAMTWQQMVPAGAMRGVGGQMVSLGTFQRQLADANVQLNLGWLVDEDHLRILLQAKDNEQHALPEVELRVTELNKGVVFSRKTNQDGAVVAPNVQIGPGQYQIQVCWMDQVAETPVFVI